KFQKDELEKSCSQLGIESIYVNMEDDLLPWNPTSMSNIFRDYIFKVGVDVVG
ncbi:11649_t:CDS:2, partial [Cetraspora pellucida]